MSALVGSALASGAATINPVAKRMPTRAFHSALNETFAVWRSNLSSGGSGYDENEQIKKKTKEHPTSRF